MKKLFIVLFCILLLTGCETKEERDKRLEEEQLKSIKEEVTKSEVPENAKEWLVDIKSDKVLTVLCISTSNKCTKIKENLNNIKSIKTYYFNVDEISDEEKDVYKTEFELPNYTGYLPYLILSNDDKLIDTTFDIFEVDDINKFIEKES